MAHKTSTKPRPTPLRDIQIAVQADQSRRYLILDAHSPLPSPAYPFDSEDHSAWQVDTLHYRSHVDPVRHRSFTPPISPPALSPREQDTVSPAQANGNYVFTHEHPSTSPAEDGLPEDMQDMLRQLDDLATWVKAASSSRDCSVRSIVHGTRLPGYPGTDAGGHNLSDGLFPSKGKNRLLSTSPPSECDIRRDLVDSPRGAVPGNPTKTSPATDCHSEGFIYVPDCNTPEFLAGCSNSPIAYPVCGYSSLPRYSPHPTETTHYIPYHRRFLERRSAPCPPSTSPLASPPSGKTSFKTLFQRSRCNTAVSHPTIPSGHVPVENALRQGKRMRLPWLRI